MLILSVYLFHSEGLTCRNNSILEKAGGIALENGGPWLLAGDFNMTPDQLSSEAAEWLGRIGGTICSPGLPTCK